MITTAIIGLLATASSVSYGYVRQRGRDAKRVADIRTLRNAIETYFEQNGSYPPAPAQGVILGTPGAQTISDAGLTALGAQKGIVYLQSVPTNVEPGGVPYAYRSLNDDGSPCLRACEHYEITFRLEGRTGEFEAGDHLLTDDGVKGLETGDTVRFAFLDAILPPSEEVDAAIGAANQAIDAARSAADRGEVQLANKAVVAPVSIAAAIANLIATAAAILPAAGLGQFLGVLLLQPLYLIGRRRRESWGTVYDFNKKIPVDLATVRLLDAATNRPVATKVTDKDGRYAFSPRRGTYRLEVVKPGYVAPAPSAAGLESDGRYVDLYRGTLIRVDVDGQAVAYDVPIEPKEAPAEDARVLLTEENKKALRRFLAKSGPVLGALALAVSPSTTMLLLFLFQVFVYLAFKRLASPRESKNYGVVYEEGTRDPVAQAVVRVLSLPYHKVLETKLTDAKGRYSFFVGAGKYYLTVTKPGYEKTETSEIDYSSAERPVFIASDLPMRRPPGQN